MAKRSKSRKAEKGVVVEKMSPASSAKPAPDTALKRDWFWGLALIFLVVLVYIPVWWAGYIWDDDLLLTANPALIDLHGLKEIWTTEAADICPLTLTTFWVEHVLWGLRPLPYHVVNVILHGASTVLLWQVLRLLKIPGAWLGAALWAAHPVLVESVAWIAEMKNTESCVFYLLAIFYFVRHLEASEEARSRAANWNYGLTLLFSAMAMASKSSTVILPLVLCLCAWWMEGRWKWRQVLKVSPILVMSVVSGVVSIWKQKLEGADDASMARSWPERAATAGYDVWFYLGKLLWPHPLIMVYPSWRIDTTSVYSYLPTVGVVVVLGVLWLRRESWGRFWFFAFAYFLVALLPVIGLLNMKYFRYSLVADHFQYLAAMGPIVLVGAGIFQFSEVARPRITCLPRVIGAGLILLLGVVSWQKASVFQNETTLWNETLAQNPDCYIAYNNLGMVAVLAGRMDDALPLLQKSLEINPGYEVAHNNMASALTLKGDVDGALAHYQAALKLNPNLGGLHANIGLALEQKGRLDDAIGEYQKALEMDPEEVEAGSSLGLAYVKKGWLDKALTQFEKTVGWHPEDARAHTNYGSALFEKNRFAEAIVQYQEALRLKPGDPDATKDLPIAQAALAQKSAAVGAH